MKSHSKKELHCENLSHETPMLLCNIIFQVTWALGKL